MARLPQPGNDDGIWGSVLNDFLSVSHASTGTLNSNVVGAAQVQDGTITGVKLDSATQATLATVSAKYVKPGSGIPKTDLATAVQTSLTAADSAVQQVNGKTPTSGSVTLAASDVGALTQTAADARYPQSATIRNIVQLSQSAYNAISSPAADTLYIIV